MIISSTTDIATYIDDTRADVRAETGAAGVSAAVEALRAADHPAWGTDWSGWLSDDGTQDLITEAASDDAASEEDESAARCECGEVTGEACEWCGAESDRVTIETMPDYLRASHDAAGNRGTYPHNGAMRLRVSPECAAILVEGDEGWTREVRP